MELCRQKSRLRQCAARDRTLPSAIRAGAIVLAALAWTVSADRAAARDRAAGEAALDAALATVTAAELREHVGVLADDTLEGRAAGSRGNLAAARYIEAALRQASLAPGGDHGAYIQRFNPGYQNLIGVLRGADPEIRSKYLLVGAHFDHVGYGTRQNSNGPVGYIHNGADDNASGVAVLLEVVDALARTGWQPRRSIVFAFWDGEEINLLGSRHWVRQPTVPLADVQLAINADMVGRMTGGRLEVEGTRTAPGLRRLFSTSRLPEGVHLDFTWEYTDNSDHWPLFEAEVPSMLLHTGLHSDYHRPSDDVEKLNIAGMRHAAAYLLEIVCRLADADELPKFRAAARSETPAMRKKLEAPLPAAAPRLGLAWKWEAEGETRDPVLGGGSACRLRISSITPDSPAAQAGLRVGDCLASIDGHAIMNEAMLPAAVLQAGAETTLEVVRADGSTETIRVVLAGEPTRLGLSWREDAAAPGAVFVTRVVPYSPADRAGIAVHDRIYSVDGQPFADKHALLEFVRSRLADDASTIRFEIETAGRLRPIEVDLRLPAPKADPGA
jgi:hypothetical protein